MRAEFERKATTDSRFTGITFPDFIIVAEPAAIPESLTSNPDLDPGEIAAIALALGRGITDVLIDEQAGRAAAIALGLHVSGLLGVLIEGKHRRLVSELGPVIDSLVNGAKFWINPRLRERILNEAGEKI